MPTPLDAGDVAHRRGAGAQVVAHVQDLPTDQPGLNRWRDISPAARNNKRRGTWQRRKVVLVARNLQYRERHLSSRIVVENPRSAAAIAGLLDEDALLGE